MKGNGWKDGDRQIGPWDAIEGAITVMSVQLLDAAHPLAASGCHPAGLKLGSRPSIEWVCFK